MRMRKSRLFTFFVILFFFNMAASFAHPVTPTLIIERNLDSSMFGVALAAMMTMNFLFSPFWGKLCGYMSTRRIMLICSLGYALGQIIFGTAMSEVQVVGGKRSAYLSARLSASLPAACILPWQIMSSTCRKTGGGTWCG